MNTTDWIGFLGVGILLTAYVLSLKNQITQDGVIYLGLNTVGAGLACLASILLAYWPFILLEGCWTLVSLAGLIKSISKGT